MAGLIRSIEDLVVEHGEVERETEADGVRWGKVCLSNFGGSLVGVKGLIGGCLAFIAKREFGQVAVVVSLPISKS